MTKPGELSFNGKATLHTFPTGIYLRFGPATDGKWHWRKWTTTEYGKNRTVQQLML